MKPLNIGNRRELFWDDALIETSRTTAELRLHSPRIEEIVLRHDAPWEGDGCNAHSIIRDGDRYRMYYLAWKMLDADVTRHSTRELVVCYAESRDGLRWEKPALGICEYAGSRDNNILLDKSNCDQHDMPYVFLDENPACPPRERFKMIRQGPDKFLTCYVSEDGIHFRKGWALTDQGKFDTQNIAMWVPEINAYMAYIRNFHERPCVVKTGKPNIRDIRWMTSPDFRNWSEPQLLDFGGAEDYPLYVNAVQRYARAPHQFIGFPSRYVEREAWTPNYDQLAGADLRRKIAAVHPRYGLATTDCVFMTSRDGRAWTRFDEAFLRPGIERVNNWVYGDGFIVPALIETPSPLAHAPAELSLYSFENHWRMIPAELRRYTMRLDGFVSRHAGYAGKRLVTRPFIFAGSALSLNFSTSARGSVYITLRSPDAPLTSCEIFGDSLARTVPFDGDLAALAGREVVLEIALCDADVFSFRFA
jgi:hypothetical protein